MEFQIESTPISNVVADWLVTVAAKDRPLTSLLAGLDEALGGTISRLVESEDLNGETGKLLSLPDVPGLAASRLLLVGIGTDDADAGAFAKAMQTAARACSEKKSGTTVAFAVDAGLALSVVEQTRITALAMTVGGMGQDLYRSEPGRFPLAHLSVMASAASQAAELEEAAHVGVVLGEAMNLTRELVNRPADDIHPETFAARAEQVAADVGLAVQVLGQAELETERMGSMLAVARGSDRPPRLVVLRYRGGADDGPVLGLCGKGVTFDSGGLSLKTSDGMKAMKCDMAGAATVLGAMSAIAQLRLPVNVNGYLGLVENMVSGRSYKLGDVLTARNGVTIEVHNTDAEGRLVLADVLSYAADDGVAKLVDLATLTGSCVVALGDDVVGAFGNDDDWAECMLAAAATAGEDMWRMPMFDHFSEQLKSDVSDIKNVGTRSGGSITAAKFLERFVGDVPWVHLDIAGPAFAASNKPHREGGASGCMVRTLVELARNFS
ncbi:MAG: leucyl aminopeptidase [Planctomycetota bacterium]|nr:leucyl aminopeptidase [Planctomycetota bacterium]